MTLHAIPANPVPDGAVSGHLVTLDGVRIRYARWHPAAPRRGTVCVLPGRADCIEKYFEVIEDLRRRGFAVAILDWRGQGGSQRMLKDQRKGHVKSFDDYQLDLEVLIRDVVLPDCPPPIFALAHSMGGLILIEAVHQGRRWFDRAVLSAPMLRFGGNRGMRLPREVARLGTWFGLGTRYVPGGGPLPVLAGPFEGNRATSDPVRYQRNVSLLTQVSDLALGSPTVAWAHAAYRVMHKAADPAFPETIRQPLLIVTAGDDQVVANAAVERFAIRLRAGSHLTIPGSRHEILNERDVFRDQFWAAFDAFVPGSPLMAGAPMYR